VSIPMADTISATQSIAQAEALIDKNLPRGWRKMFVEPPWRSLEPVCRGCGKDPKLAHLAEPGLKWANSAIVKNDAPQRTLWYSFALVCENCVKDRKVMNRLAIEVFAPQSPEAGLPEITIETSDPSKN